VELLKGESVPSDEMMIFGMRAVRSRYEYRKVMVTLGFIHGFQWG
jgi:hypothetical protein